MTEGILNRTLWKPLLVWIFSNCSLVLVPALLVVFLAVKVYTKILIVIKLIFYFNSQVLEEAVLLKLNAI
jgi:hypothetical protein